MSVTLIDTEVEPVKSELVIRFGNHGPTDAEHIGRALVGISESFHEFYRLKSSENFENGLEFDHPQPRLMIKKTKNGSLSIWLIAVATQGKLYYDYAKNLLDFGKFLKKSLDYFSGRSKVNPNISMQQLNQILSVTIPIAAANDGQLVIEASEGDVKMRASYKPAACGNAANRIRNEIASRRIATETHPTDRYLFYWYRATNDTKAKTGDRGRIDEISDKALKVIFFDETTKEKMLEGPIFERSYLVEGRVRYKMKKPIVYEILRLIEIIDDSDD